MSDSEPTRLSEFTQVFLDAVPDGIDPTTAPDPGEEFEECPKCDHRGRSEDGTFCRECEYGREQQKEQQRRIVGAFDNAGSPLRLRRFNLRTFQKAAGEDPNKETALNLIFEYVEHGHATGPEGVEREGLFLWGPNGVGKSGLVFSLARELWRQGRVILWIKYEDLIRDIQALYGDRNVGEKFRDPSTPNVTAQSRILNAQRTPVLVLDDLGRPFANRNDFRESEDRRELLFSILSFRHERHMPTFITSNLDGLPEVEEQFDPRIADRVMESCTIAKMSGENLRSPKNQSKQPNE